MEEKQQSIHHTIMLDSEKGGTLTGILDVISFNETEIRLTTARGNLVIKGKNLHVSRLYLENGEIKIEGQIDSMAYVAGAVQKRSSLTGRLFR